MSEALKILQQMSQAQGDRVREYEAKKLKMQNEVLDDLWHNIDIPYKEAEISCVTVLLDKENSCFSVSIDGYTYEISVRMIGETRKHEIE